MEGGEGMVAVVRGLRDAGLAVTLLDGTRQYTLMPNAVAHHTSMPTHVHISRNSAPKQQCAASTKVSSEPAVRCDSAAQATDGRYASVYKMAHCNITPTSPPILVTEFPPQRAEVCPGHGNFEVGGTGSGDTCSPTRGSSSFRGGMSWPDRGSVCTPRPSHGSDPFANSLRRYPSVSPERSSEMVERLINYTQTKNSAKKSQISPTRVSETNSNNHLDWKSSKNTNTSKAGQRICEPEVCVKPKIRIDESPTRDGRSKRNFECEGDECRRSVFGRNYDVKYLRDVTKRHKETMRNVSTYPYSQPVCPNIKERYDHLPPEQRKLPEQNSTNSVNMEIQAAVQMISREVATLPSRRHVAVPLSPTTSTAGRTEGEQNPKLNVETLFKSVQTTFSPIDLTGKIRNAIQTTSSSIELLSVGNECRCSEDGHRKTRSQEELKLGKEEVQEEIVYLLENLYFCDNDKANKLLRDELLKKYKNRIKRKVIVNNDQNIPILHQNWQYMRRENRNKTIQIYRAEVGSCRTVNEEHNLDVVIGLLLKDVKIKNRDFLGRPIDRQQVINTIISRIKKLVVNVKEQYDLKTKIIDLLEEVPIVVSECNKSVYLTGLAKELLKKMNFHKLYGNGNRPKIIDHNHSVDQYKKKRAFKLSTYIQPTEKEMKEFIKEEFTEFLEKSQIKICPKIIEDLELELIDLLIDSVEDLFTNNISHVKEEIVIQLCELASVSEHQATYFATLLLEHLKEFICVFEDKSMTRRIDRSQTFVVLQNTSQNASRQNEISDFSIGAISEADIEANLDFYVRRLTQEIDEWINNIPGVKETDHSFRQVVVNDLAGDIVDRHKYLEMNPAKRVSDESEIEHLKCQIFKWINKLIGEDDILDALEHASELFERVQKIPRPMLMRPYEQESGYTFNNSMPPCCAAQSTLQSKKQSPSAHRVITPNRFSGNKPGFDANKLPTFGPVGPGGSMTEAPTNNIFSGRRQSSPGAYASGPMPQNTRNITPSYMPIFSPPGPAGRMADSPPRSALTHRKLSGPGAIASGSKQTGMHVNQMPVLGPAGPGGSMTEARNNKPQYRRLSGLTRFSNETVNIKDINVRKMPDFAPRGPGGSIDGWTPPPSGSRRLSVPAYLSSTGQTPLAVDQLNAEYDNFVKNWVKEIPISASNIREQEQADKARLGIYNGIWKTIAKLELEPLKLLNPFYCQDVLDYEVDDLLSCLPQTQELIDKKRYLKSKLIEKTGNIIELKVSAMVPENFKQQLIQNVTNNLPKRTVDIRGEDHVKLYEDIEKLSLAEEFILYTRYKEDDKVKADVYRKKLANHIEQLVQNIKESHGTDLNKISPDIYIKDVINALHRVPLPSDETIREEADEILLGLEIERWFSDLPVVENDEFLEQICRRRLRYALAKKIRDMEKTMNFADSSAESQLKQEIARFLQRLPMKTGENVNLEFIADELINRLKNRPKEHDLRRGNSAALQQAGYGAFVQNIPFTSSYADLTPEPSEKSSYIIREGSRYDGDSCRYEGGQCVQMRPENESEKWLTLEETRAPPRQTPSQTPRAATSDFFTLKDSEYHSGSSRPVLSDASQVTELREPQIEQNQNMQHTTQNQVEPPHVSFKVAGSVPLYLRDPSRVGSNVVGPNVASDRHPNNVVPYTEHRQGHLQSKVEAMEKHVASIPVKPDSPQHQIGSFVGIEQPIVELKRDMVPQDPRIQTTGGGMEQFIKPSSKVGSHRAQQSSIAPVCHGSAVSNVETSMISIQAMVQAMDQARAGSLSAGPLSHQNQIGPCITSGQSGIIPIVDGKESSGRAVTCGVSNNGQAEPLHGAEPFGGAGSCVASNISPSRPSRQAGPCVPPSNGDAELFRGAGTSAVPSIGQGGPPDGIGLCVEPSTSQSGPSNGALPCLVSNTGHAGPSGRAEPCVAQNIVQTGPNGQVIPCRPPTITTPAYPNPIIQQLAREEILGTNQVLGPSIQKPCCCGQPNILQNKFVPPLSTIREFRRPPVIDISSSPSQIYEQSQRHSPLLQEALEINKSMVQGAAQPISEPNRFIHAPATTGTLSIMNQHPVGYSTPQPVTSQGTQGEPPRLARRTRVGERPRSDIARRRLELQDTDEEMERERDEVQSSCLRVQPRLFRADHLQRKDHEFEDKKYLTKNRSQFTTPKEGPDDSKSIQTALSLMDIKYKSRFCQELRRKSQEDLRINRRYMQEEVLEWWQVYRDKAKVKKWGEKLQKIAEKLKKPGGEEKLRMKIMEYLKRLPSQQSVCDDDSKEFREHLPDNIIRKLKKYYLNNQQKRCPSPVKVFRQELPKYNRHCNNNHKTIIRNWLKTISIRKRDFLGRLITTDDVVDYITHKISPILITRPDSVIKYKYRVKSYLIDIFEELPILISGSKKSHYFNKIINKLLDALISDNGSCTYEINVKHAAVDCQLDIKNLQAKEKVIRNFVAREITSFVDKSHIYISTKRMAFIEYELTDILMDAMDYLKININESIKDDINIVLRDIGKLTNLQAEHLTKTLFENLKYLHQINRMFPHEKELEKCLGNVTNSKTCAIFQNGLKYVFYEYKDNVDLNQYEKLLFKEIDTWLKNIQIPLAKEKDFRDVAVKDLADEIKSSCKNIGIKNEIKTQERLHYQILKWTNKLIGRNNIRTAEYAQELMQRIQNIPSFIENCNKTKLRLPFCQVYQASSSSLNESNDYVDQLTKEIFDWFQHLPRSQYRLENISLSGQLIKDLVYNIDNGLKARHNANDVINKEIDFWTANILKVRPSSSCVEELKFRLKNIHFREKDIVSSGERIHVRQYENLIEDWLNSFPVEARYTASFMNARNMHVRELAIKLSIIKSDLAHLPAEEIAKKNREHISNWLIKISLLPYADKRCYGDRLAAKLTTNIQNFSFKNSIDVKQDQKYESFDKNQLESVLIEWLYTFPLYQNNNADGRSKQTALTKKLSMKLNQVQQSNLDINLDIEIRDYVKILLPQQDFNNELLERTVNEIKVFLQKSKILQKLYQRGGRFDTKIESIIEIWLKNLPLNSTYDKEQDIIKCSQKELIQTIKEIQNEEHKDQLLKEAIHKLIISLPIDSTKCNKQVLNMKNEHLIRSLAAVFVGDVENDSQSNTHRFDIINSSTIYTTADIVNQDTDYFNTKYYLKQLTDKIEEWLSDFHIQQDKEKCYRQVVVNDLAQDIIDRHKYVKINPSCRGSDEAELEHLKYQIFKWINKLVGEGNLETIAHAPVLMQKIRSIPVSLFIHGNQNIANNGDNAQITMFGPAKPIKKVPEYSSILGISSRHSKELISIRHNKDKQMPVFGSFGPDRNLTESNHQGMVNRRLNNPFKIQLHPMFNKHTEIAMTMLNPIESGGVDPRGQPFQTIPREYSNDHYNPFEASRITPRVSDVAEYTELEEGTTLSQVYDKYSNTIKHRCDEIPLATPTPEQESLVKITRQILYNNIWKTFFTLKSDPEIENDYLVFEFMLEDRLDEMYDCLPEAVDVQKYRQTWKAKVVLDVMKMLKKIHSITDSSSFRIQVANKIKRYVIRSNKDIEAKDHLNYMALSTADQYVVYKKYQDADPIKANIYKQRLMKHVEEIVSGYDLVKMPSKKISELQQQLFLELDTVPIPGEDILEEEVDEIMIGEEIEKWFNGLPLYRLETQMGILMRERLRQLLAKNIHEWEKRFDLDEPSTERNMKHDVSVFLSRCGILQQDVDLNINLMVDELTNRLKARRQRKKLLGYQSFEREQPLSSTLAPLNTDPVLPYLIAAEKETQPETAASGRQTSGPHPIRQRSQVVLERSVHDREPALASSQLASCVTSLPRPQMTNQVGPNYQDIIAYQRPCWTGRLGTSQEAGPSHALHPVISNQPELSNPEIIATQRPCWSGRVGTSLEAEPSHAPHPIISNQPGLSNPEIIATQRPCWTSKLEISQEAGPSQPEHLIIANQAARSNQEIMANQRPCTTNRLGTSQEPGPNHATYPCRVPILGQSAPNNQTATQLPSNNIRNVQEVGPHSAHVEAAEHASSRQSLPSHGFSSGQRACSTARVMAPAEPYSQGQSDVVDTEEEGRAVERYHCRCINRVRCRKRRYVCGCDESDDDDPRYMNVPCRYYY